MNNKQMKTKEITFARINEDLENAHVLDFDITKDRIVFFSDMHKGTKKKNDAFRQNESTYCIALDYYFKNSFKLIQAGDIEEGWGFKIKKALSNYKNSVIKFESKFVNSPEGNRYYRIYGNHDINWRKVDKVKNILKPMLTSDSELNLKVKPSLKLGDKIVVLHGHQGSIESDLFWKVSKGVVRFVTSVFFRTFGRKKSRAANNSLKRQEKDILLNSWATINKKILIAGHTHRFLFGNKHSLITIHKNLEKLSKRSSDGLSEIEKLLIEQNKTEYESQFSDYLNLLNVEINENCYFNIGAGVYSDGISCIEIDQGVIKLLFWSNSKIQLKISKNISNDISILDGVKPEVLFSENLEDILNNI